MRVPADGEGSNVMLHVLQLHLKIDISNSLVIYSFFKALSEQSGCSGNLFVHGLFKMMPGPIKRLFSLNFSCLVGVFAVRGNKNEACLYVYVLFMRLHIRVVESYHTRRYYGSDQDNSLCS